jgi:hypothetical protein
VRPVGAPQRAGGRVLPRRVAGRPCRVRAQAATLGAQRDGDPHCRSAAWMRLAGPRELSIAGRRACARRLVRDVVLLQLGRDPAGDVGRGGRTESRVARAADACVDTGHYSATARICTFRALEADIDALRQRQRVGSWDRSIASPRQPSTGGRVTNAGSDGSMEMR